MNVHVSVHFRLKIAIFAAAEVDPAVCAVELEIERLAVLPVGLAMTTPTVEKPVRPGGDPFVVSHIFQHSAASIERQSSKSK